MTLKQAIEERHSVRSYLPKAIEEEKLLLIEELIEKCNKESGLHLQLIKNEKKAFDCFTAHYGKFENIENYIACIGRKEKDLEEKVGYYGQKVVLYAQTLGLNTCWVGLTFKKIKTAMSFAQKEKFVCVIALGYGKTQGKSRPSKQFDQVCKVNNPSELLKEGVKAALLAPTAMNQQKFEIGTDKDGKVFIERHRGIYTKIDLGIVKYNFEVATGERL